MVSVSMRTAADNPAAVFFFHHATRCNKWQMKT